MNRALAIGVVALVLAACETPSTPSAGLPSTTPQAATPTPTPAPVAGFHKELSGVGQVLTDSFEIPAGNYRVSWEIKLQTGVTEDTFIADAIGQGDTSLVITFAGYQGNPTKGSTLFQSAGGKFAIQVKTQSPWWITFDQLQ